MSLGRVIWNQHAPDATIDHGLAPGAFLTLDTIDISDYVNVLHPRHAGEYGSIAAMSVSELIYPSTYQAMQFMAFFNSDATSGLLVMTKDPDANVCEWLVDKVAETLEIRSFGPSFPVETTVVSSRDEALDIYKAWARDQFWWAHGTKPRLKGYLGMGSRAPMLANHEALDTVDAVGVGGGIRHLNYRNYAFDTQYPDYSVADPVDFADVNDRALGSGYIVAPYINSLLWDVNHADYNLSFMALDENGDPYAYDEILHHACPYLDSWQDRIEAAATQADFPESGIYLDVIGTRPKICYSTTHGHAAGSSASWQIGLRAIAERLGHLVIIVEGAAEVYQDFSSMMFAQNTDFGGRSYPIWLYVYGRKLAGVKDYITAADSAATMLTKVQVAYDAGVAPTHMHTATMDEKLLEAGYEPVLELIGDLSQ